MASRAASGVASSICLAKQADLEAVAFSCTGRRLARAAYGLGFRVQWTIMFRMIQSFKEGSLMSGIWREADFEPPRFGGMRVKAV